MSIILRRASFIPAEAPADPGRDVGFRHGRVGTHTSRTIMLDELVALFASARDDASRGDYAAAIVDANCLSKPTSSARRLSNQRLHELYGLDPAVPMFRALRRLWDLDAAARPLLASCALARDPLLAATAPPVLSLPEGAELLRDAMSSSLRDVVANRLNDDVLDKVVRNAASSWTHSGHLHGRRIKKRQLVRATPANGAFAAFLASAAGFRGWEIFASGWFAVLDLSASSARALALEAKRLGLIDLRLAGDVVELDVGRLLAPVVKA